MSGRLDIWRWRPINDCCADTNALVLCIILGFAKLQWVGRR